MTFRSGDIVLVPFPFTNLTSTKRRPALLLRGLGEFGDWLCLPVTTQSAHQASVALRGDDFVDVALPKPSWVRVNRPTILSEQIMLGRIGNLTPNAVESIACSMCVALACHGHSLMENAPSAYGMTKPGP